MDNVLPFRPRGEKPVEIRNVVLMPGVQTIIDASGVALFYQIEGAPVEYYAPDKDEA